MKKSYSILILIMIQAQILKGAELILDYEIAQRYLNADLVVIGEVVSIKTETILQRKTINNDGWDHIDRTLIDIYSVKIDSVIKGSILDSLIIVQSKPFYDEYIEKFENINDDGDSVFTAVVQISDGYRDGADIIHKLGKHIILIKFEDYKNISTLTMEITISHLNLLQKAEEKGIEAFILKPPDNINK